MKGFSLIELLITLTVLGVLAGIGIPSYQSYKKRMTFSELIQTTSPYKAGVEDCLEELKTFKGCQGGSHHVPKNSVSPTKQVASILVKDGVITMTPVAGDKILATDVYILTPTQAHDHVVWRSSGGAVNRGVAN